MSGTDLGGDTPPTGGTGSGTGSGHTGQDTGTGSISACLNPNDLYYQFDRDGNFSPNATIHDQGACQQDEEHIPDSNIQADEDIPVPDVESQDTNELTEPKNNNVLIALAVLGGLFWL